jgi:hypothetical protein
MSNPKLMKVSDEEREKATQQLSRALATGRIDYVDFEARLDRVFAAQNYIELGDVVVDLPVRAPTPPPSPTRYDYLPTQGPSRQAGLATESSNTELDRPDGASRVPTVLGMGLHAALVLAAVAVGVRELVVDVLPSASPVIGAGLVLIAIVAVLLAVYWAVATVAAVPHKVERGDPRPPEITP